MLLHIGKALLQFFDPATWGVIIKSFFTTVLIFLLLLAGAAFGFTLIPEFGWSWVNDAVGIVASLGLAIAFIFLLIPASAIVLGFFAEELANKVEDRWYGGHGQIREPSIGEVLTVVTRMLLSTIFLNLLALPFYLFLPGINIAIYLVLNGILVGREFFEMVALRHVTPAEAKRLRGKNGLTVFLAGAVTALALSIPGANFLAPVFGASLMVHVYRKVAARA